MIRSNRRLYGFPGKLAQTAKVIACTIFRRCFPIELKVLIFHIHAAVTCNLSPAWLDACWDPLEKCQARWQTTQHIFVSERTHRFDTGTNLQEDQSTKSGKQMVQVGLLLLVTASPAWLLGMAYSIYLWMHQGPERPIYGLMNASWCIQKGTFKSFVYLIWSF